MSNGASTRRPVPGDRRQRVMHAALAIVFLVLGAIGGTARAHDVPGELRVHMHVKPEGERLHVLVRIPLALLLNLDLPKHGPGYLDLAQIEPALSRAIAAVDKDVAWFEEDRRLTLLQGHGRITPPSDRSFESFESSRQLLRGPPLPAATYVFWNQGYFDAHLQYPIRSPRASVELDFRVAPGLRDRLKLDLRYITADGETRAYELTTGAGRTALDPHWNQAAWTFVKSGFDHILDGPDHLLFLLCLVLPFRRISGYLLAVVTSFTAAHSVTLIAAAYGWTPGGSWFEPLVELLIAASVLYMAIENLFNRGVQRRWIWSGLFGLVHGFGFSFVLSSQLQFAGSHLLLSLLAFNLGIELGQILVLLIVIPSITMLLRTGAIAERTVALVVSVLVGHTAWHWAITRAEKLWAADWSVETMPASLSPLLATVAATVIAAIAGLGLMAFNRHKRAAGLQGR